MADYDFRYRLDGFTAREDGSGDVSHSVQVEKTLQGGDEWSDVPTYCRNIPIAATGLGVVMDMPDATGPQQGAKTSAYMALLTQCARDASAPYQWPLVSDWSREGLEAYMDAYDTAVAEVAANDAAAAAEAVRADGYITETLGLAYPMYFYFDETGT